MLTVPVRLLGDADRGAVERVLDQDPIAGAQVAERVDATGLSWWRSEARVLGYSPGRRIESVCWLGANLIPVHAAPEASAAFAELIGSEPRTVSSIVGSAGAVLDMWTRLAPHWGPARDVRPCQPLLAADVPPAVAADPNVRLVRTSEINQLFPAAVAMYTEEVGISPLVDGGERGYRDRMTELVRARRSYARFIDGEVAFKAELAVVTRRTAQVQGVWVNPKYRGRGLAIAGMAAVVRDALRRVAPNVSLYVNDYNLPARRVYERCGFTQVGTFATVLF